MGRAGMARPERREETGAGQGRAGTEEAALKEQPPQMGGEEGASRDAAAGRACAGAAKPAAGQGGRATAASSAGAHSPGGLPPTAGKLGVGRRRCVEAAGRGVAHDPPRLQAQRWLQMEEIRERELRTCRKIN